MTLEREPEREPADRRSPIGPVHHVGIVVRSIEQSLPRYEELFGLAPDAAPRVVEAQQVRLCFLPTGRPPAARLELIQPLGTESGVARYLANRGEGLHHVCFGVRSVSDELAYLATHAAELIDAAPRAGAEGLVAFVHPRTLNGVLWELADPRGMEG
ncbi:MAG: VOC family protein [Chloroflexota bacterium]|nr:VOC family protein [Chloroflexota bacterium]